MTPDSSEIAKHVRAVHFALVLACVLVLTIALAASPSSVEIAHNQLQKVIAIKENWKDWTRRVGREQLTWLTKNGIVPSNIPPPQLFVTPEELARRNLSTQTQEWSVTPKYIIYFYMYIRRPPANIDTEAILAWAQRTEPEPEVNAGGYDSGDSPLLTSLEDFRLFWNAADKIYVFTIAELSPVVYLVSNGQISNRLSSTPRAQSSQSLGLELRRTGLNLKGQEKCDALTDTLLPRWKPKFNIMFCGASPVENAQAVLPARVVTRDVPMNLRLWLSREFSFSSVGNNFENTFSELHLITQPYQRLSLDDAKTILGGELRRAGERVQFLGLSFPERFVSTWVGVVIILVVQLYFWIHLRELRSRLVPNDSAVKVAWIGLYPDWIARLVSILTAAILPFSAVLYLAWIQRFSRVLVGLSALEFVVALTTAFVLHRLASRGPVSSDTLHSIEC